MHSRRALLYMPGDDRRKIEKAATLGVDCVCMDMEDGVAISHKAEARAVIAQAMKDLDFGNSERCIRINSFGSGFEKFDLAAAVATNPASIVLPKVETAAPVKRTRSCTPVRQWLPPARHTNCRRSTWSILISAMWKDCASKRSREHALASAGNRSFIRTRWQRCRKRSRPPRQPLNTHSGLWLRSPPVRRKARAPSRWTAR